MEVQVGKRWKSVRHWGSWGTKEEPAPISGRVPDPAPLARLSTCSTDLTLRAFPVSENRIPWRLKFGRKGTVSRNWGVLAPGEPSWVPGQREGWVRGWEGGRENKQEVSPSLLLYLAGSVILLIATSWKKLIQFSQDRRTA